MGATLDEALLNAEEALRDYAVEAEKDRRPLVVPTALESVSPDIGSTLVTVPLLRLSGRSVRANPTLDEGVAAFIDGESTKAAHDTHRIRGVDGAAHRTGRRIDRFPRGMNGCTRTARGWGEPSPLIYESSRRRMADGWAGGWAGGGQVRGRA